MDEAATDKKENSNYNQAPSYSSNANSMNQKRQISDLSMKKNPSNPAVRGNAVTKKPSRKELNNIDDEAYQRIKTSIENFSKAHQNVVY